MLAIPLRTLAGAAALAACSPTSAAPTDAAPAATLTLSQTLPPGMVEEGTWSAGPGDAIIVSIAAASASLDWDIHAHADGQTQDIANGFADADMTYALRPTSDGPWYLLLRNHAQTTLAITVQMDLYGDAAWQGWQ